MFGPRFPLLAAVLVTASINGVAGLSCDDEHISIATQKELDFYKNCTALNFDDIDHTFKGSFDLPGVESVTALSSGYYGEKRTDRIDDGVTSISMPDLKNITSGGLMIGYVDNITSVSLPKLETVKGDIQFLRNYDIHKLSLPLLETVDGGIYLVGPFDGINLPSLKSANFVKVVTVGDMDCRVLGKAFSSLKFTPGKNDFVEGFTPAKGFTCYNPFGDNNSWDSNDPENVNAGGDEGGDGGSTDGGDDKKNNAASLPGFSYGLVTLIVAGVVLG